MRVFAASAGALVLAAALFAFAGTASALSINPNPIAETRAAGSPGGSLSASLSLVNITGNTATFQLAVSTGTLSRIDISMLFDNIAAPTGFDFVVGASFGAGSGVGGGTATVAAGGSEAQFVFAAGGVTAGNSSRPLVVTFASPILATWQGAVDFDNGYVTTRQYSVAVPEAGSLLLLGLALGAGALARRTA
jgi:hypothetical protein